MVLEGGLTESIILPSVLHPFHFGKRQDSLIEKKKNRTVNFNLFTLKITNRNLSITDYYPPVCTNTHKGRVEHV